MNIWLRAPVFWTQIWGTWSRTQGPASDFFQKLKKEGLSIFSNTEKRNACLETFPTVTLIPWDGSRARKPGRWWLTWGLLYLPQFWTGLKRIHTPNRCFYAFWGDKPFTICWSGSNRLQTGLSSNLSPSSSFYAAAIDMTQCGTQKPICVLKFCEIPALLAAFA